MQDLIFDRPDLQSLAQKYGYYTLTFFFWMLWLYLWLPLVSLMAWLFEISVIYEHMVLLEGYRGVLSMLGAYALVILAGSTVYLGWAGYSYLRFKGVERRQEAPPVTVEQLAGFYSVDPAALLVWQHSKRLTIHHDAEGNVEQVVNHRAPVRGRFTVPPRGDRAFVFTLLEQGRAVRRHGQLLALAWQKAAANSGDPDPDDEGGSPGEAGEAG